jgi:hypothetical protein
MRPAATRLSIIKRYEGTQAEAKRRQSNEGEELFSNRENLGSWMESLAFDCKTQGHFNCNI